jgi:hypothetical protein
MHKRSGQRNPGYVRLLVLFIVVNAVAALLQMCGAIVFYSLSLVNKEISASLRQGIVLVRLHLLR